MTIVDVVTERHANLLHRLLLSRFSPEIRLLRVKLTWYVAAYWLVSRKKQTTLEIRA